MAVSLKYDGSFEGFLTAVFDIYDLKLTLFDFIHPKHGEVNLFNEIHDVITDEEKSDRVWKGIEQYFSKKGRSRLYYTFLSEQKDIENVLFETIAYAFKSKTNIENDFTYSAVLKVAQMARSVHREKHRMEAFVRFKLTKDNIYFSAVTPDFNVLPLISKHFEKRYADQQWLIYDLERQFGLFYNLEKVEIVSMDLPKSLDVSKTDASTFTEEELDFQQLWKDYFNSTNIESRKNMKLHIRHVPKRYWKYLSEKQP
ncbi:TIGR03915 family putative DNA repair protein [Winogradskyella maritima]|uniref:TIGR03915 family putative DNA repair protein n=1 Tax=Winogradskyella maritima TaxID=1517766 RepID=A0ABV8AJR6_9FLAO|nr:TIGR03915 family putative DNA repair protein [Winogradskyella maritima]